MASTNSNGNHFSADMPLVIPASTGMEIETRRVVGVSVLSELQRDISDDAMVLSVERMKFRDLASQRPGICNSICHTDGVSSCGFKLH